MKFSDRLGTPHDISFGKKDTVFISAYSPIYHQYLPLYYFNTGNSSGIDAAAGIKIRELSGLWKFRPVGVAADKHHFMLFDPFIKIFFNFVPLVEIPGRAGGVMKAYNMHIFPEIS